MVLRGFLVLALLTFPPVLSAPTTLDTNTLQQNGLAAQQLNAQFQTLKVTDSCNTGDTACISGLTAQCTNSAWQTQQCTGGNRECFALPSVTGNGTFIACTSEINALSLITATGVQGGLTSNSTSSGTSPSIPPDNNSGISSSASSTSRSTVTVTQTVTLPSAFAAQTFTIPPAEASSLISSLLKEGASTSFNSTPTPTSTSSTSTTPSTSNATSTPSPPIATIIKLNRSLTVTMPFI